MKHSITHWMLAVCAVGIYGSTAAQNLIDATHGEGAGSFELGLLAENIGGYMHLEARSTDIVGWSVGTTFGGVDWLVAPKHRASDGTRSVDLSGALPGSGLYTTVPTTAGSPYNLQFATYAGMNPNPNSGRVSAGSLAGFEFTGPVVASASDAVYVTHRLTFRATSSSTFVTFEPNASDGFGPVIDQVSVTPADPELTIQVADVEICWSSQADKMYVVQYRSDLTTNLWTDLAGPIQGTGTTNCITDSVRGEPRKFYRVTTKP